MPCVRLTVLRLKPRAWQRAAPVLGELDDLCAADPQLMMSFVFGAPAVHEAVLGRISFWETEDAANRIATMDRTLALRAQLQTLSADGPVEVLAEIRSGFWPKGVALRSLPFVS